MNSDKDNNNKFTRGLNSNFRSAKDVYFSKIKMPGFNNDIPQQDPKSKYAYAARKGLCFHCMREDENPQHRPKHLIYAFCPECMMEMSTGTEKLVLRAQNEINTWFG